MSLIKGKPDLKFVIKKAGLADTVVLLQGFTEIIEDYEPVFISHELDSGELLRRLEGFRYRVSIFFEGYDGALVLGLSKIMNRNNYDTILFYPNHIDRPLHYEDVTIDDDTIRIAYMYLLANKDLEVKLIGRNLIDGVPLQLGEFRSWGNLSLQFKDLNMTYQSLYQPGEQQIP